MPAAQAQAQQWVAPPIRTMPGTTIPYPNVWHVPPPVHTQPGFMQSQALPTHLVCPTRPRQGRSWAVRRLSCCHRRTKVRQRIVAVDELRVINPWNGEVVRSSIQPRQGVYQRPLKREEFYRLIGGDELGASTQRVRVVAIASSSVARSRCRWEASLAIVGGTMAMIAAFSPIDPKTGRCGPLRVDVLQPRQRDRL